jgi:hypothetical protein
MVEALGGYLRQQPIMMGMVLCKFFFLGVCLVCLLQIMHNNLDSSFFVTLGIEI